MFYGQEPGLAASHTGHQLLSAACSMATEKSSRAIGVPGPEELSRSGRVSQQPQEKVERCLVPLCRLSQSGGAEWSDGTRRHLPLHTPEDGYQKDTVTGVGNVRTSERLDVAGWMENGTVPLENR